MRNFTIISIFSINKTVKKEKSIPAVDTKWNTCDDYQSSPIENEEWLAFIRASMQEVLNGEIESIKQQNLVSKRFNNTTIKYINKRAFSQKCATQTYLLITIV